MQPVNRPYDYVLDHTNRLMLCGIFSFWSYVWDCIVHWFFIFCVKHMHWFSQKLVCLKRKNSLFQEGCTADCFFICNGIHHICCCIPWLLIILFYWSTNLWYNYHYCWTCVQEELYLPVAINLTFFLSLLIIYPQPFVSMRASTMVHPYCWALSLFAMKKNLSNNLHALRPTKFNQWGRDQEGKGRRGRGAGRPERHHNGQVECGQGLGRAIAREWSCPGCYPSHIKTPKNKNPSIRRNQKKPIEGSSKGR